MIRLDVRHDLTHDVKAVRARRRPVTLNVRFMSDAGTVQTDEGAVHHGAGAAVMTGVHGEHWPVERERFEASYEPVSPTRMGEDGAYRRRATSVVARRYDAPFVVDLGQDRGTLRGAAGDWLVQYGPGELGVVSAGVFEETYEVDEKR